MPIWKFEGMKNFGKEIFGKIFNSRQYSKIVPKLFNEESVKNVKTKV